MANITAAEVNELRKITGAGMMDCKKALVECEGNFELAIDFLRKKGQKVAANRSDKEAKEGIVLAKVSSDKKNGVIIILNCETDFVAKNQEFIDVAQAIINKAIEKNPSTIEELKTLTDNGKTIDEKITEYMGKSGEKVELTRFEKIKAQTVIAYNHQGNKLATLLGLNLEHTSAIESAGKEVAMQVAAMNPVAVDMKDVDQTIIDRELEIYREQIRAEGKPDNLVERIATGKLNSFYKESTLLNQDFVRDTKKSVKQFLKDIHPDLTVTAFKRFRLGE